MSTAPAAAATPKSEHQMHWWLKYAEPENWHPAAAAFPRMTGAELRELADDIAAHGLHHKVTVLDGKVIDGINRVLALQILQAESKGELEVSHGEFVTLKGGACFDVYTSNRVNGGKHPIWTSGSPTEYVISQNSHRRHMTYDQRVAVASELAEILAAEGKERKQANLKRGNAKPEVPKSA